MAETSLQSTILVLGIALLLLAGLIYYYLKHVQKPILPENYSADLSQELVEASNLNPENASLYNSLKNETYK